MKSLAQHIAGEKRKSKLPEKRKRQYKHILERERKAGLKRLPKELLWQP